MGHMKDVVVNCSKALEMNPQYTKALERRAKAYEAIGLKEEAILGMNYLLFRELNSLSRPLLGWV